jgi:hypothetical protein
MNARMNRVSNRGHSVHAAKGLDFHGCSEISLILQLSLSIAQSYAEGLF